MLDNNLTGETGNAWKDLLLGTAGGLANLGDQKGTYYVNANYTDGKFQFNRCFYFDENNKVVFILTWFAYEYNS